MMELRDMLDRDEELRIFPGLSDASDLPPTEGLGEQSPAPTSVPPSDGTVDKPITDAGEEPRSLVSIVSEMIGHETVGDPVPALVHMWRRQYGDMPVRYWEDVLGSKTLDMPMPGDIVKLQYQATYDRYWYGVVTEVIGNVAWIVTAKPLRHDAYSHLTLCQITFKPMRGWSLSSSWPVVSFIRP